MLNVSTLEMTLDASKILFFAEAKVIDLVAKIAVEAFYFHRVQDILPIE